MDPRTKTFELIASPDSTISKLYTNNGVLTIFFRRDSLYRSIQTAIEEVASNCFNLDIFRVFPWGTTHSDKQHDTWHKEDLHIHESHSHLIKLDNVSQKVPLTSEDIQCLILGLKASETKDALCQNGKTACFLTDADTKKIVPSYFFAFERYPALPSIVEPPPSIFTTYTKAFCHAFLHTLIDHYIMPYLINETDLRTEKLLFKKNAIRYINNSLKIIVSFIFSFSIENMCLEALIKNIFAPLLIKFGFNQKFINHLTSIVGSAAAVSVPRFGISSVGAITGKGLAHTVIYKLPKLKYEPPENPTPAVEKFGLQPNGLRKRKGFHASPT